MIIIIPIDIEDACVSEVHNEEIANTQVTVVPNPVTANLQFLSLILQEKR